MLLGISKEGLWEWESTDCFRRLWPESVYVSCLCPSLCLIWAARLVTTWADSSEKFRGFRCGQPLPQISLLRGEAISSGLDGKWSKAISSGLDGKWSNRFSPLITLYYCLFQAVAAGVWVWVRYLPATLVGISGCACEKIVLWEDSACEKIVLWEDSACEKIVLCHCHGRGHGHGFVNIIRFHVTSIRGSDPTSIVWFIYTLKPAIMPNDITETYPRTWMCVSD
jgi:hypothetical protein